VTIEFDQLQFFAVVCKFFGHEYRADVNEANRLEAKAKYEAEIPRLRPRKK